MLNNDVLGSQLQVSSHHEQLLKRCKTACLTLKSRFEKELDPTLQQLIQDAKPLLVAAAPVSVYTHCASQLVALATSVSPLSLHIHMMICVTCMLFFSPQPQATNRTAFGIVLKGCHVESCVPGLHSPCLLSILVRQQTFMSVYSCWTANYSCTSQSQRAPLLDPQPHTLNVGDKLYRYACIQDAAPRGRNHRGMSMNFWLVLT